MKKFISITSIICMVIVAFLLTASTQQDKGNGKGNQEGNGKAAQQKDNKGEKEKQDHANKGKHDNDEKMQGHKKENGEKGKDHEKGNGNDNGDHDKMKGKDNHNDNGNGKGKNKGADYYNGIFGYHWDKDNFNDRRKYKSQDKVSICHKISKGNGDGVEISVSENAVKAHLNHGDVLGQCPVYNRRFTDVFYRDRKDYYNTLQGTQEQVYYSQSILDYALARLAYGRGEVTTLQNNNAPLSVIQGRQESVNQLEQNVSLLQTLIGVAVTVVANKLQ